MIVGRISCSFDRGVAQNVVEDVVDTEAVKRIDISSGVTLSELLKKDELRRGLGTRFISPEAKEKAVRLGIEEGRVNRMISRAFLRSPIPGLYIVPSRESLMNEILKINPNPEINCRAVVYVLEATEKNTKEVEDWIKTIKAQLTSAPLGRAKEAGAEGLAIIEKLASCPVLSEDTKYKLLGLVGQARLEQISRLDFKRAIADVELEVDVQLADVSPARAVEPVESLKFVMPDGTVEDFARRSVDVPSGEGSI